MSNTTSPKTIIVTGAGSGIGFAVARAFLERGDNVVLNGRTESKLQNAAKQLGHRDQVAIAACDITLAHSGQQLVDTAVKRFGRLDILFNNAGVFEAKPFNDYATEELDAYLGYLRGAFLVSQAAARQMRRQNEAFDSAIRSTSGGGGLTLIHISVSVVIRSWHLVRGE